MFVACLDQPRAAEFHGLARRSDPEAGRVGGASGHERAAMAWENHAVEPDARNLEAAPRRSRRVEELFRAAEFKRPGWFYRLALSIGLGLIEFWGVPATAQTYTVDSISTWSIGTVAAAATGTTEFLNSADGYVNVHSGNGSVVKGPYAYETVGIRCVDASPKLCSDTNNKARIRVGRLGINTGRGQTITVIGAYDGTGTIGPGTNQTNQTVDVTLSGWTASNQVRTFRLSCYWPIGGDDGSGATGAASSQFYVYAAADPTVPVAGMTGTITGTVVRALTITKISDLRFGTFIPPVSGNASLVVDPYGARGVSNGTGTLTLVPSTFGPAQFNVTGEPGATFTLTYPSNFTLTGPGAALVVTFYNSPSAGTITVPGSGALSLYAGGYFSVSAGQASGNYSGSFIVTIAYN